MFSAPFYYKPTFFPAPRSSNAASGTNLALLTGAGISESAPRTAFNIISLNEPLRMPIHCLTFTPTGTFYAYQH